MFKTVRFINYMNGFSVDKCKAQLLLLLLLWNMNALLIEMVMYNWLAVHSFPLRH